jgi:ParB-like chromosome segregation protein Spo0J
VFVEAGRKCQPPQERRAARVVRPRWLPRSASNKNFATCLVVDFARARKRLEAAPPAREQRGPTARLARALDWQRQLDAGEVASRADIARREGLSRARVT